MHELAGTRHRIVHDYRNVNAMIMWETVKNDLPALIAAIQPQFEQTD